MYLFKKLALAQFKGGAKRHALLIYLKTSGDKTSNYIIHTLCIHNHKNEKK